MALVFLTSPAFGEASCKFSPRPAAYPADQVQKCVRGLYDGLVQAKSVNAALLDRPLLKAKAGIEKRVDPKVVVETFQREAQALLGSNAAFLNDLQTKDAAIGRDLESAAGGGRGAPPRVTPRVAAAGPASALPASAGGTGGASPLSSGGPLRGGAAAGGGAPASADPWVGAKTFPDPPTKIGQTQLADRIIGQYGLITPQNGDREALGMVLDARADPAGSTDPKVQAAARAKLSALFPEEPPFTDPLDMRLARVDHVLNVRKAVQLAAPISSNDPWYRKGLATVQRIPMALGSAGSTLVYDGSKWLDQRWGWTTGRLIGQDFSRASPSDVSNTWSAVKTSFSSLPASDK